MAITRIQFRRGTAAQWNTANPTLAAGELGFESDTGRVKIGTGAATWLALPYFGLGVTDHGALTGNEDDDHAQYLRADGARQLAGDLAVASGATIDGRDISADGTKLDALWGAPVALTDGPTIALNAALGATFRVALGGNRTLGVPTNPTDGQSITLEIAQDGVGGRTLTLASGAGGFAFGADGPLAAWQLSSAPNALDVATFKYRASAARWLVLGLMRGF